MFRQNIIYSSLNGFDSLWITAFDLGIPKHNISVIMEGEYNFQIFLRILGNNRLFRCLLYFEPSNWLIRKSDI